MRKIDRITIGIGIAGIVVGLIAWLFPLETPSMTLVTFNQQNSTRQADDSEAQIVGTERSGDDLRGDSHDQTRQATTPLIRAISYDAFSSQLKSFPLDSHKLDYIKDNKHLLADKLRFSQMNEILAEFSLDSTQIEAVALMRASLLPPSESDLEVYTSYFSLASTKREALDLIYRP